LTITCARPGARENIWSASQFWRVASEGCAGLASHWLKPTMASSFACRAAAAKAAALWIVYGCQGGQ
jgi:hypothetical protein